MKIITLKILTKIGLYNINVFTQQKLLSSTHDIKFAIYEKN